MLSAERMPPTTSQLRPDDVVSAAWSVTRPESFIDPTLRLEVAERRCAAGESGGTARRPPDARAWARRTGELPGSGDSGRCFRGLGDRPRDDPDTSTGRPRRRGEKPRDSAPVRGPECRHAVPGCI